MAYRPRQAAACALLLLALLPQPSSAATMTASVYIPYETTSTTYAQARPPIVGAAVAVGPEEYGIGAAAAPPAEGTAYAPEQPVPEAPPEAAAADDDAGLFARLLGLLRSLV